jgi:hypothetical protein
MDKEKNLTKLVVMEKEFVPYDIALTMKELGFDIEFCLGYFTDDTNELRYPYGVSDHCKLKAPTYQQAFRWFREKHGISGYVRRGSKKMHEHLKENGFTVADWEWRTYKTDGEHLPGHGMKDTYQEAQDACLRKLIEIVKENL